MRVNSPISILNQYFSEATSEASERFEVKIRNFQEFYSLQDLEQIKVTS